MAFNLGVLWFSSTCWQRFLWEYELPMVKKTFNKELTQYCTFGHRHRHRTLIVGQNLPSKNLCFERLTWSIVFCYSQRSTLLPKGTFPETVCHSELLFNSCSFSLLPDYWAAKQIEIASISYASLLQNCDAWSLGSKCIISLPLPLRPSETHIV